MDTLLLTRILCIALWLVAAAALLPSFTRYVGGSFTAADELRTALFGAALLFVGSYVGRVLLNEGGEGTLLAINVFTAVLAIFVLIVLYQGRRS